MRAHAHTLHQTIAETAHQHCSTVQWEKWVLDYNHQPLLHSCVILCYSVTWPYMLWWGSVENGTALYACVCLCVGGCARVCVQYLSSEDRFSPLITKIKESDCFIAINNWGKMKQHHGEQQVTLDASSREKTQRNFKTRLHYHLAIVKDVLNGWSNVNTGLRADIH